MGWLMGLEPTTTGITILSYQLVGTQVLADFVEISRSLFIAFSLASRNRISTGFLLIIPVFNRQDEVEDKLGRAE